MVVVDLGSNTFRAVRFDCRRLEPVEDFERIVRTADGLVETGRISSEAVARIVEAAAALRRKWPDEKNIFAVATEALRRAVNAEEVLVRLKEKSGIVFEIIDGKREAAYTLLAVRNRLARLSLPAERFVLVDIGGGSTEVLFYDAGRYEARSFPLGIVTTAQAFGSLEAIAKHLPDRLEDVKNFIEATKRKGYRPEMFVATAGTPTTVAAMMKGLTYTTYDPKVVNGTVVPKSALQTELKKLLAMDQKLRAETVGVGREDLIAAGILIFEAFYELLEFHEAVVVDDGLREGVAIEACRERLAVIGNSTVGAKPTAQSGHN